MKVFVMRHTRFLIVTLLVLATLTSAARAAGPDRPATGSILLVERPKVYDEPTSTSNKRETRWEAGCRLQVLKRIASADAPATDTLSGWFQVKPAGGKAADAAGWAPGAYLAPPPQNADDLTSPAAIGLEPVDRWHGLAPDYAPKDLVPVGPLYDKEIKSKMRREAAEALTRMFAAAKVEGVRLEVVSGYRAWETQQRLYQAKLASSGWDQDTVARPGHSEHQLGTAADLTDGNEKTLLKQSFGETKAGRWLAGNAWRYGFAQSFTVENRAQTGIAPEPWHYRYRGIERAGERHKAAHSNAAGSAN